MGHSLRIEEISAEKRRYSLQRGMWSRIRNVWPMDFSISISGLQYNTVLTTGHHRPHYNSPASFSTSCPQTIYLFVKCSIQPFMFSLEKPNNAGVSISEGEQEDSTDISS